MARARRVPLEIGGEERDWDRTVTLHLELTGPLPGMATQTLAGKALRRLKALRETGEIPSSDCNRRPAPTRGEPAS